MKSIVGEGAIVPITVSKDFYTFAMEISILEVTGILVPIQPFSGALLRQI